MIIKRVRFAYLRVGNNKLESRNCVSNETLLKHKICLKQGDTNPYQNLFPDKFKWVNTHLPNRVTMRAGMLDETRAKRVVLQDLHWSNITVKLLEVSYRLFFFSKAIFSTKSKQMAKKQYYAVQNGRNAGVYSSWNECNQEVKGYSGAVFKKFDSYEAAQSFSRGNSGYSGGSSNYNSGGSYGGQGSSRNYGSNNNDYSSSSGRSSSSYNARFSHAPSHGFSFSGGSSSSSRVAKPSVAKDRSGGSFYAVKSSNAEIPSKVFNSWKECQAYTHRQKGLSFKKFDNMESASNFARGKVSDDVDYGFIGEHPSSFGAKYQLKTPSTKYDKQVNVYCDGSSLANGTSHARAGYGAYFENEPGHNISERLTVGAQTNNRGEIQAVSSALDKIWNNLNQNVDKKNYKLKTDSEYVAKLLNDRYGSYTKQQLKELPNSDLAVPMIEKYAKVKKYYEINKDNFTNNGNFEVEWVKAHAGLHGNEMADQLAKEGAMKKM